MPSSIVEDDTFVVLRIRPADKARIIRAVALEQSQIADFILRSALTTADAVIDKVERVVLSERDTRLWSDLMDNPPKANARLVAAAKALPAVS